MYKYAGNDPVNALGFAGLSVGQPSLLEGMIPVWGSARGAVDDFQNGRWGWGLFNGALAVTDVFLIKALVTNGLKLLGKGAAREVGEVTAKNGLGLAKDGCFLADTQILAKDGPRPIQEIKVGDEVYATDLEANRLVLSLVATAFQRTTGTLVDLTIRDVQGREYTISGTPDHPFFVPVLTRYVEMGTLEQGTALRTDTGAVVTVVASKIRRGEFTVYNFEVERVHNYFVKSSAGGPWILVHNNPCANAGKKSLAEYQKHQGVVEFYQNKIKELTGKLANAKGKEPKAIKEEIAKWEKNLKGHLKEMGQKWPGGPPKE